MARCLRHLAALSLALMAAAASAQATPAPVDPRCTKLLPLAEMEKLSGVRPLQLVGRFEVQYAGGTCNYVTGSNKTLVLLFSVAPAAPNTMEEFRKVAKWAGGAAPLPGLGDEALKTSGSLAFRKGNTAVRWQLHERGDRQVLRLRRAVGGGGEGPRSEALNRIDCDGHLEG
jgi:hypothetical protein